MNWIQRKIYLYNVTFGLYMLDWWERYLFIAGIVNVLYCFELVEFLNYVDILVLVLMWFIFYNGSRYIMEFFKRYLW